ncbi:thiamine phosphate synthase [Hydrotalea sp.]|uniref:thiamine phosphate synthase n=1 Tax=Hydrotalea sp. TaxID=2881279 RepID=UPI0025829D2A|nr:thiamine phosphate synthase [Hydrotalea sp.]
MDLIVITPPENTSNETEMIHQMFQLGLQRLHIRKPNASIEDYHKFIEKIDPSFYPRISIHAHPELIKSFTSIGYHCTGTTLQNPAKMASVFSNAPRIISASFHSWKELENNNHPFEYIFISPVFNSISKSGYTGNINISDIQATRLKITTQKKVCPKIIGLGGISETNLHLLFNAGFDGIAAIGSIWLMPNPVKQFILLRNCLSILKEKKP